MSVKIKKLSADIVLKNKGIELEIRDNHKDFLGDLIITKSSVIWCEGRTKRSNGIKIPMGKFLQLVRAHAPAAKKAAKKAVKKAAKKTIPAKKSLNSVI